MHSNGYANGQAAHNKTEILDRQPPSDPPSEAALLGSVLLTPGIMADVAAKLSTADLYDHEHQPVYRAMLAVHGRGLPVDATLVAGAMADAGAEHAPGILAGLLRGATAANWRGYLNRVLDCAARRRYIQTFTEGLQKVYGGGTVQSIQRHIEESLVETVKGDSFQFKALSCAELDSAEYHLEYLIADTLVAGQPLIIAGGKKCLKTGIIIAMALSLATGGDFLGYLCVNRRARVMVMSGESGPATIQETARRMAEATGFTLADISGLYWEFSLPQFARADHLAALERLLTENEIEVLFVDPAYLCLDGSDAGNLFIQGQQLRIISELCQRVGVTLVLAHHTRKSVVDQFAPAELEDIAWAGFQEFARQWLLLSRREKYEPGTGDHKLWLNVGGSAGHSALWALDVSEGQPPSRYWSANLMRAEDAREAAKEQQEQAKQSKIDGKIESIKEKMLKAMRRFPKGETEKVIRETAGLNGNATTKLAFGELLTKNDIEPCGVVKGVRSTPYRGYRLVKVKEETD